MKSVDEMGLQTCMCLHVHACVQTSSGRAGSMHACAHGEGKEGHGFVAIAKRSLK